MKRHFKGWVVAGLILTAAGCGTADLSSYSLRNRRALTELEVYGRQILAQATERMDPNDNWKGLARWEVVTVDDWTSPLIRAFTPIKQSRQKLRFVFSLDNLDVTMHYLDGKAAGHVLGLEDDKAFSVKEGSDVKQRVWTAELYLKAVKDYFMWPFILRNSPFVAYSEDVELNKRSYLKIYASGGEIGATFKEDQYIVWVNKQTQLIDYIEFTMRDLWPSYRGVVEYSDYRQVDGYLLPFQIQLRDQMDHKNYSHRFLIEEMQFK